MTRAHPLRRLFNLILFALCALGLALAAWALWFEPRSLTIKRTELVLPRWPRELSGLRIALLSDLHVGSPHWDIRHLAKLVQQVNAEKPDLILLAGDYQINGVWFGRFVQIEPIAAELGKLQAPLGVIAVLGNHDWWNDGERARQALSAQHITVLEDSTQRLETRGQAFYLVGLADLMERSPHIAETIARVPAGAPSLVLVHEPDAFPQVGDAPVLTMAGHTHGGQVKLPFFGRPIVPSQYGQRYASGHVVERGRHLFVTNGVGTSIWPVRFCVPPEVSVLTLNAQP